MDDLQSSEEVNWELCVTERGGREGFVPPGCYNSMINYPVAIYISFQWQIMWLVCDLLLFRPPLWWMKSNKSFRRWVFLSKLLFLPLHVWLGSGPCIEGVHLRHWILATIAMPPSWQVKWTVFNWTYVLAHRLLALTTILQAAFLSCTLSWQALII